LNVLKIDRSFIAALSVDSPNYPVVKAILSLADSVGLTTIAEGIETSAELQVLRDLGCLLGQGNLFSPAVSAAEVVWPAATAGPRDPASYSSTVPPRLEK
jgi:EAL domain-containing protein (putative c-di-GMP-specific phosphodiesterase class I)